MVDREELLKSIEPKSDQLNADDLIAGPRTVTVTEVSRGDREQPIVVAIEGHRPYKPCKSMRRLLIALWGDAPKEWIGRQMTLYCDPDVTWGGLKVGGIRISHVSHITEPKTLLLTHARGKRTEYTVRPLTDDAKYIAEVTAELGQVETVADLTSLGQLIKSKPKAVQDALRPLFQARRDELAKATTDEAAQGNS